MANQKTVWGIHAAHLDGDGMQFINKKIVALGWADAKDLSAITSREQMREHVNRAYPDRKPKANQVGADQLFRFIKEMKQDDVIAYPCKSNRRVYVGRISGEYQYSPQLGGVYPNLRSVTWIDDEPRTRFSQGALYEIGSAMSFFQIKNHADEFIKLLSGGSNTPVIEVDTTVNQTTEQIEETTRDYVLKRLTTELKGYSVEKLVAHLLELMGYHARVIPAHIGSGVDIVAHRDELGFEPPIIKVQVKSGSADITPEVVHALNGNVMANEAGLLGSVDI